MVRYRDIVMERYNSTKIERLRDRDIAEMERRREIEI